jgi:hypothetical protein
MERVKGEGVDGRGRRERGEEGGKKRGEEWWIDMVRTFGAFGILGGLGGLLTGCEVRRGSIDVIIGVLKSAGGSW